MILSSHGIIGSQIVQFSGLLDTYTGAAAAYSLRLLRAAYTGYAIKVRRASDNTEQDIGFSNNELDTTTLASFCSGTNGFVTTWYDQSGNGYDATQTTAANQPKVYDSSTGVITENGKAAVQFDGSVGYLQTSNVISGTAARSIFAVHNSTKSTSSSIYTATKTNTGSGTRYIFGVIGINEIGVLVRGGSSLGSYVTNSQHLVSHYLDANANIDALTLFTDSTSVTLTDVSRLVNTNNDNAYIGMGEGLTEAFGGTQQELIIYLSNESTNRSGIETNINDYYAIY